LEKHLANLLAMQSGAGQPPPDRIEFNLQDSGGTPQAQAFGHQFESHKNFFLGTPKVEESRSVAAGEGLATGPAEEESGFASASGSIGPVGDHIAKALFVMVFAFRIGTRDIQIFRFRTTSLLRSHSHPLLLSKERITQLGTIINILQGHYQMFGFELYT
jgi:hypothetical protein